MIKVGNKILDASVKDILLAIQEETRNRGDIYLRDFKYAGNSILVTCPFHKNHNESKPACGVFIQDTEKFKEGEYHCFACGAVGNIVDLASACLECSINDAKDWLIANFGNIFVEKTEYLPEIVIEKPRLDTNFIDPAILSQYHMYHPYMEKRKISPEVAERFYVGYDKSRDMITFPVFDEKKRLVMITARSVTTKRFYIEEDKLKPVYLLYDLIERNVKSAIVVESQINCLTLRTWGYDSVGLIGTGSSHQYDTLKKSGIRTYFLALDGDTAGKKGILRFIKNMPSDIMINIICIPEGKDVNDLTMEEFLSLEVIDKFEWKKRFLGKKNNLFDN